MAKPIPTVLYMVIDITTPETTQILKIVPMRQAILWGHIFKAEGKKVTAREVAGKSFAVLDKLSLQYLYWDLVQAAPPEDYGTLVQNCLAKIREIPQDESSVEKLMWEINRLGINLEDPTSSAPKEPKEKDPNAPPARPKATTTTGLVWQLADEAFEKAGNQMPNRADVIAACEAEGINSSTAATQYAKWKKAKGI